MTPETLPGGAAGDPRKEPVTFDESTDGEPLTGLDRAIGAASKVVAWLVFISMAISVFEVISRYAFNSPTSWVHETTVFLIAVIFVLGGPVALARNKHIRVRILYDIVSPRVRRWLDILNGILALLFTTGMTFAAWKMFYTASHNPLGEWQLERSGTSWNPAFPAYTKALILFALALMTVQVILHLIHAIRHRPAAPAKTGGR